MTMAAVSHELSVGGQSQRTGQAYEATVMPVAGVAGYPRSILSLLLPLGTPLLFKHPPAPIFKESKL